MDLSGFDIGLRGLATIVGVVSGAVSVSIALFRGARYVWRTRRGKRTQKAPEVRSTPAVIALAPAGSPPIHTPDKRLRVFVSSTLQELAEERVAAKHSIERLRLTPILFETGARAHPPRSLYRAYLEQSDVFVGIYWQRYGWVAPGETISGLEDEYRLSGNKPRLIYLKSPAPDREPLLSALVDRIRTDDYVSYKTFKTAAELRRVLADDLALMLTEHFAASGVGDHTPDSETPRSVTNLPVQPTPLIGREVEVTAVRQMLAEQRLVTLTGAGGTGKTRLALEVGERERPDYPDGVWFVDLGPISDPNLVVPTIARTLGIVDASARSVTVSLEEFLQSRRLLLIVDNFEHLLQAAPAMADLLAASAGLRILATSREPLRLRGEHEAPVPPLGVPDLGSLPAASDLARVPSVALFAECAAAVKPGFRITEDNAAAVAAICAHLDGLPLAIELAGARLRLLSPGALAAQLEHSLGILTDGPRDLPSRQRTLRAAIQWSHDLLEAGDRAVFRRLAVLVGGATLDCAAKVCCAPGDLTSDVLQALESLVAKSLLMRVDPTGLERVRMLETVREYALEQLDASAEADSTWNRHVVYFLGLCQEAFPRMVGPQQRHWAARLDAELANINAALKRANEHGDVDAMLGFVPVLGRFSWRTGRLREGHTWVELALAQSAGMSSPSRAGALMWAGILARRRGLLTQAEVWLDQAVVLYRTLGDTSGLANALHSRGIAYQNRSDMARARAAFDESILLYRASEDAWGIAAVMNDLGEVARLEGDHAEARGLYQEALTFARARGDPSLIAVLLEKLGYLAFGEHEYARATELVRESLLLLREAGCFPGLSENLEVLAALASRGNEPVRAARLYGAAEALREATDFPVPASDRQEYDADLAVLRSALAAQDFGAAWAEGRHWSPEQAINYALRESEFATSLVAGGRPMSSPVP